MRFHTSLVMQESSSVFDSLAKPVRKALVEIGFLEPTLPQTLAIPHILAGENVLLIAPTGTGKTEAVLLPIFSRLVEQQEEVKGIQVIYITPLRALNRDMLKRLTFWAEKLGLTVEVRHGDTEMKIRRKQARQPPRAPGNSNSFRGLISYSLTLSIRFHGCLGRFSSALR